MNTEHHQGLYAKDLPPEKLERLLREGYTVSPNSGRLRKRISTGKKHSAFSKRKAKKYSRMIMWAFLIIAFLISLVIILPEMAIQNNPKMDYQKNQMRK